MTPHECPHCAAMFWHIEALAEHRKKCRVWAGEKKPKKPEPEPQPDIYDKWLGTLVSERVTKILTELGPATIVELAYLAKSPPKQVRATLDNLRRGGIVIQWEGKWQATGVPYSKYANRE